MSKKQTKDFPEKSYPKKFVPKNFGPKIFVCYEKLKPRNQFVKKISTQYWFWSNMNIILKKIVGKRKNTSNLGH